MKKLIATLTALLLLPALLTAGEAKSMDKAIVSYTRSLDHSNPGVVNSAMTNLILLKAAYPDGDYGQTCRKLERITKGNAAVYLRYKAFLAVNYINNPQRFNWIEMNDHGKAVKILELLDERLEEQLRVIKELHAAR